MRVWIAVALVACSSATQVAPPPPRRAAAVVATSATPPATPPALRLPGDVRPTRSALELTIVPEGEVAPGAVTITATVVRATRVVWLNATDLAISHAELDGHAATVIAGNDDFVGFALDHALAPGPLTITIAFTARIDHGKSRGIYAEREGSETYAYTFFEAIDARRAFPCFDEPAYKIPWQLTLHVKADAVALGNAAVVRESAEPAGMKRVELAETKPLPSYLVAFIVGPFELVDDGVAGRAKTPVRFAVPKGRGGELAWAKAITPRVVAALEDYFAMDYPYGKLDVAVVPRYWGTMEHPGLVAMGQPLALIRPEQATRSRKQGYANILAHELGHYWFGDLVTMAWWDDTWLNEALGEWLDMIVTDAVEPAWRYRDDRVAIAKAAMASDEQLSTQAIRQPVTTREAIAASFDADITYFKGSSVLRMLEAYVGADRWRDFLRGYVRAHAGGNASADDLLAAVTRELGEPTAAAMRSFLEQPGVPLITAAVRCEASGWTLVLAQTRSLQAGLADPNAPRWHVPIQVRYGTAQASSHATALLDGGSAELHLAGACPTWLVANAGATGYYRSVVDPAVARALLTPGSTIARSAAPTVAEKLMLVADLRAAVDRGDVAIDQVLALVPVIAADPDPKVARAAISAAGFRADALAEPLMLAARAWTGKTFGRVARRLGWHRGPHDDDELHELRRTLLPMIAPFDPALAAEAGKLADRWLIDRSGVDDDLVAAVLGVAAYHGDRARFTRYVAAAHAARDRTEQQQILGAVGGFRDPAIAADALALVLDGSFDLRESLAIASELAVARETRTLALQWLRAHLDELLARMRDDEGSWFLGELAGGYCDAADRAIAEELVGPRAARIDGAQAVVKRGLEASELCIERLGRVLPSLTAFLAPPRRS